MIDLKFLRENPDVVKENIKKKFQDHKLPLVDEVIELDAKARAAQSEADELRASRNKLSKQIGALMGQGKKDFMGMIKRGAGSGAFAFVWVSMDRSGAAAGGNAEHCGDRL